MKNRKKFRIHGSNGPAMTDLDPPFDYSSPPSSASTSNNPIIENAPPTTASLAVSPEYAIRASNRLARRSLSQNRPITRVIITSPAINKYTEQTPGVTCPATWSVSRIGGTASHYRPWWPNSRQSAGIFSPFDSPALYISLPLYFHARQDSRQSPRFSLFPGNNR